MQKKSFVGFGSIHCRVAPGIEFKLVKERVERVEPFFDVVVVAVSAGGLNALSQVLGGLPKSFPAAIAIVMHMERDRKSLLVKLLSRRTLMQVCQAEQAHRVEPGMVYICPPDHHMRINSSGKINLDQSLPVNFMRPSADLLFVSAAKVYGPRAIALVLTGMGHDGSAGVQAIKQVGGYIVAQDQSTSTFSSMPASAALTGLVDQVLPLPDIAAALTKLVTCGVSR